MTTEQYLKEKIPYKRQLTKLLAQKTSATIFDIGSCEGLDAIRYSKLFPSANIIAFEPIESNVKIIQQNIKRFDCNNIEVFPFALGEKVGTTQIFKSSGNPKGKDQSEWNYGNKSSSILEPQLVSKFTPWLDFNEKEEINICRLDSFCQKHAIDSIDFVHMDVQGAELMVLKGAGEYLSKISMVWLEVENVELYRDQPLRVDIEDFMLKNGFKLTLNKTNSVAGDQLYTNKLHNGTNGNAMSWLNQKFNKYF